MKLLVTGVTGKVGQKFLPAFLSAPRFSDWDVVALCNNRVIESSERVSVIKGSISDKEVVSNAISGVTHIVHLAAVKETPELIFEVALKGLFVLLEECRKSDHVKQFIHLSGDCVVGHIFHEYDAPITEASEPKAYSGCYALTKVLEEAMLKQFGVQYGMNWSTLRAPWIMDKDDFRFALEFGEDQFGGPAWEDMIDAQLLQRYSNGGFVPVMRDVNGQYLKRSFLHVDDLVFAIIATIDNPRAAGQLFNIAMDEPVDYGAIGKILHDKNGLEPVDINTPFHSNWLDNSKARMMLGWRPEIGLEQLVDRAWEYKRDKNDPRVTWYPG